MAGGAAELKSEIASCYFFCWQARLTLLPRIIKRQHCETFRSETTL